MNFEVLSHNDTTIWLANLDKAINLLALLSEKWSERSQRMDSEYQNKYCTGWRKFWYQDDYWCGFDGHARPMGSFFTCSGVEPLSKEECTLRFFINDDGIKNLKRYRSTQERWAKYAKQPFEVQESDIIFYQGLKEFHKKSQRMAKLLGMDYEAFNMDEDRKNRS